LYPADGTDCDIPNSLDIDLNLPPASARVNIDVFSDEEGRLRGQWSIPNGNPQPIDAHIIFDSHMQVFPV
jgi:hypothetical protein